MLTHIRISGVRCTPHDPIECTGRNPVCVFSRQTKDYRCCSDVSQDLSNPPGIPEQVKPSESSDIITSYSNIFIVLHRNAVNIMSISQIPNKIAEALLYSVSR